MRCFLKVSALLHFLGAGKLAIAKTAFTHQLQGSEVGKQNLSLAQQQGEQLMGRGIQRRHASSRRSETRMDNASWVPEMLFGTIPSDPLHNLREKKKLAGLKTGISDTILEGLYLPETWNNKVFFKIKKPKQNKHFYL